MGGLAGRGRAARFVPRPRCATFVWIGVPGSSGAPQRDNRQRRSPAQSVIRPAAPTRLPHALEA
eukprot:4931262-Alexandrium_andersonii.AAC.1